MTTERLSKRVGSALIWRAAQLGGINLIFFARLLILARLLTPDDFGLVAIAVTAIGLLQSASDFGMRSALVQGKEVDRSHYDAAWTVEVTRGLAVSIGTVVFAPLIAHIFAESRAIPIIQGLAIRPFLDTLGSIRVAEMNRNLQFRPTTVLGLVEAITNTITAIGLAQVLGVWALVIGTLAGATVRVVASYILAPHHPRLLFEARAVRPLVQFGRWIFLTSLIALVANSVLRLAISRQLGAAELGLYFLGAQLAFLPATVTSEVVGSVAFPLFARLQTDIRAGTDAFRTLVNGMYLILFPVCALLVILAPDLILFVLGPQWQGTEPVIQILAFATLFGIFGEAVVPVFQGYGLPQKVTLVELVQSLVLIGCAWGLTRTYGLAGAALAWLPATIAAQILNVLFIRQHLENPLATLGKPLGTLAGISSLGALVAWGISMRIHGMPGLILAVIVAVMVMVSLIWLVDRRLGLGFADGAKRLFPGLPIPN